MLLVGESLKCGVKWQLDELPNFAENVCIKMVAASLCWALPQVVSTAGWEEEQTLGGSMRAFDGKII